MDADGSHPADALPRMLGRIQEDEARRLGGVIGSRWVPGGSVVNWPRSRQIISRAGSLYSRLMLSVPVHDVTAGYRVYRAEALQKIALEEVASTGYCFQIDLTRRMIQSGYGLAEVPIEFREREVGESKMNRAIVLEAMLNVTEVGAPAPTFRVDDDRRESRRQRQGTGTSIGAAVADAVVIDRRAWPSSSPLDGRARNRECPALRDSRVRQRLLLDHDVGFVRPTDGQHAGATRLDDVDVAGDLESVRRPARVCHDEVWTGGERR